MLYNHVFDSFSLLFPILYPRATGAIRSWKRANRYFAHTKTKDLHKKPKSEFPTLDLKLLWESWQWNNVSLVYHLPHISDPAVGELLQAIALAGTL